MIRAGVLSRVWWPVALAGMVLCSGTLAQDSSRDPMAPPPVATAAPGTPEPSPWGTDVGMSVIVRDGKAGLVVGTRVVHPGQKVGRWTLERISETEVWLRDGASVRKVQRFGGIQRRDPAATQGCPLPGQVPSPFLARGGKTAKPAPASQASPASTKVDPPCDAPVIRSSNP